MAGQAQAPVTFEDVTVFLSRAEWDLLPVGQRELYRDVVLDTYELLTSLGYPGPKPDILYRLERGEEPWICPSSGHTGARRWQEEPLSSWWPGAGGCHGLEQGSDLSHPGRSAPWSLCPRRLPRKLGCVEKRCEFPSEVASRVGSQAQPRLVKEEAEDKHGVMENLTQSGTSLPHSVTEWQDTHPRGQLRDDPKERCHGSTQTQRYTSEDKALLWAQWEWGVEELREAVAKDHTYSVWSRGGLAGAPRPCSGKEHSYSQKGGGDPGSPQAPGHEERATPARQRCRVRGVLRKAKNILRRYRPYWGPATPWAYCRRCCAPMEGTHTGVGVPKNPRGPYTLHSNRNTGRGTSDTKRILGRRGSAPLPLPAPGARPPEAQRSRQLQDPGGQQNAKRSVGSGRANAVSLHNVFQAVLRSVRHTLNSVCQRLEHQGFSQGNSIWPIIIEIDSLEKPGSTAAIPKAKLGLHPLRQNCTRGVGRRNSGACKTGNVGPAGSWD